MGYISVEALYILNDLPDVSVCLQASTYISGKSLVPLVMLPGGIHGMGGIHC